MSETWLQALHAGAFAIAMGVAVLLQRVAPHARLRSSWRVNGGLWLVDMLVMSAFCGGCAFTVARWAERAGIGLLHWTAASAWGSGAVSVVVLDLVSYGWHRANHRVRVLWSFHQVHHSDPTFTVSTALRFHPGELLLSLPLRLAAVVLLGASTGAVLAFEVVFAMANLVEHGDIDLPRSLERAVGHVVVTPAIHRRHHTRTGPARDTNFGTIFSVWDRLLGTYTPSDSATAIETGLPGLEHVRLGTALLLPARSP